MKKSILIIGAGEGVSQATAEKFGREGFSIGLINRDAAKTKILVSQLELKGITVFTATADATSDSSLTHAISTLTTQLQGIDVLLYNAAALKEKDIIEVDPQEFIDDFEVNVAAALRSVQLTYEQLRHNKGTVLLTGGGFATHPSYLNGTLSIGKAGIRNLAFQLNDRLAHDGIYVGTLTITAKVSPDNETHNPALLAQKYWEMFQSKTQTEVVV